MLLSPVGSSAQRSELLSAVVPVPNEVFLVSGFLFVLCLLPNHVWLTPAGSQWGRLGMRWFVLGVPGNFFSAL